jgi:hypothetical protein
MRSIQDSLVIAAECRRQALLLKDEDQARVYGKLERWFLGLAAIKQWLHDTRTVAER